MARIVNPYNLDTDDDAVFASLLGEGLVWIDDEENGYDTSDVLNDYDSNDVLDEASDFIQGRDEEWVNFSRVGRHLYETFGKLDLNHLGQPNKKYKSLLRFFGDYPSNFELRQDNKKSGLYWIRLKPTS